MCIRDRKCGFKLRRDKVNVFARKSVIKSENGFDLSAVSFRVGRMLFEPLFQRPHHGQIVLRIARAEIEALGEVELIVAVLEAQTLIECL